MFVDNGGKKIEEIIDFIRMQQYINRFTVEASS
jgi:hypothetical protein